MRFPLLRSLAALIVTVAAAAGCGESPTSTSAAADAPSLNTGTALSVELKLCTYDTCQAVASGGSGTGYWFTWHNAVNGYEDGTMSIGYPRCPYNGGYISIGATVTDSNGATASAYKEVLCPRGTYPNW